MTVESEGMTMESERMTMESERMTIESERMTIESEGMTIENDKSTVIPERAIKECKQSTLDPDPSLFITQGAGKMDAQLKFSSIRDLKESVSKRFLPSQE